MTTATHTTTPALSAPALSAYPAPQRLTRLRILRSEWTKMRTQRSVVWALLSTVVLTVGVGILFSLLRATHPPQGPAAASEFDPTAISLAGANLAQVAIGVLGVMLITNEYASGLIRTSLAVVPARLPVLWAKAVALVLTTVVLCVPAAFAAFLVGQSILAKQHLDTTLGHPGVIRAVIGCALYLGGVGLLGLGLGALLRSTAGAVSALLGALFGLQLVVGFLPHAVSDSLTKYLPSPAGIAVTAVPRDPFALSPWVGLAVFLAYPAVTFALAVLRMRRSDA